MKIGRKIRQRWHDVYYKTASKRGIEFAMKCKDAAEIVDLGQAPAGLWGNFRFRLHLSLCQACQNYFETTKALKKVMNDLVAINENPGDLAKLNQELLSKHSKNS